MTVLPTDIYCIKFYPTSREIDVYQRKWTPLELFHARQNAVEKVIIQTHWNTFIAQYNVPYVPDSVQWEHDCFNAFYDFMSPLGYHCPVYCGTVALELSGDATEGVNEQG